MVPTEDFACSHILTVTAHQLMKYFGLQIAFYPPFYGQISVLTECQ